jgi:hypothetical protein
MRKYCRVCGVICVCCGAALCVCIESIRISMECGAVDVHSVPQEVALLAWNKSNLSLIPPVLTAVGVCLWIGSIKVLAFRSQGEQRA